MVPYIANYVVISSLTWHDVASGHDVDVYDVLSARHVPPKKGIIMYEINVMVIVCFV